MRTLRTLTAALAAALLVAACGAGDGAGTAEPVVSDTAAQTTDTEPARGLVIDGAWSRMSPMRAGVAAAYLEITNEGDADDALVAASVSEDVAGTVEIHETYEIGTDGDGGMHDGGMQDDGMDGDGGMHGGGDDDAPMMGMREIPSIDVPAGATVELVPGGLHLMLLDLVEDLAPGDTFELTLEFTHAGEMTVSVEVREHR